MKAEDYVCEWCDKTYKGGKELGDWTSDEVMKFANDYAQERTKDCYPKEFVEWCIIVPVFTDDGITVQPITNEVFKTIAELFAYWKDKIK